MRNGQFVTGPTFGFGFGIQSVVLTAGDIDGDADVDLVMFGSAGQYGVVRRTAPASFTAEPLATGGPATGLADIDGDGDLDGVCCGGGGGSPSPNVFPSAFELAINDGTGVFAPSWRIESLGGRRLAGAHDIDGDGDTDLVAGRSVLFNQGTFQTEPQPSVGFSGTPSAYGTRFAADVDQDGDPDFDLNTLNVQRTDGAGMVTSAPVVLPAPPAGTVFFGPGYRGDFNGDGDCDLIASHVQISGAQFLSMRLLANTGGGAYVDAGACSLPGINFNSGGLWTAGPEDLVADLDGDGDQDLFPRYGNWIWLNDGAGFFTLGPVLPISGYVRAAADFDGDGNVDLLGFDTNDQAIVAFGGGNATFPTVRIFGSLGINWLDRLAVADLDGDQKPEFCLLDNNTGDALVFRDTGGQQMAASPIPGVRIRAQAVAQRVWSGDLDLDGDVDLILWPAGDGPNTSYVLYNDGIGNFASTLVPLTPEWLGDPDGDGDLDVISAGRLVRNTKFRGNAGQRQQYGISSAGLGGMAPTLGASGPFRVGSTVTTHITGTPGGTWVSYVFSGSQAALPDFPFPGMIGYAFPVLAAFPFPTSGSAGQAGTGRVDVSYFVPALAEGATLYQQVHVLDWSTPYAFTHTNGLATTYGR